MPLKKPPPKEWRPSFSDLVAVCAVVLGVVMWTKPPSWEVGIPIAFITIVLVVFTAFRHQSHPFKRGLIAVAVLIFFVFIAWRPIWESFHKDYPRVAFNWPITLNAPAPVPADPPDMPPLNLPGPLLSKWGKAMFICPYPPPIDPSDVAKVKAQIRRNAEIYGKALDLDLVLNDIPYGIRFDVTANGTQGQQLLSLNQRYTVQLESASGGIFVTFTLEFMGGLAILDQFQLDRDSEIAKAYTKGAEQLGFSPGSCRLL
jgi:hypothetical protein